MGMLAPQFSLRSIMAAMVVCGFVSLIGAAALRGTPWAIAVIIGLAALVLILAVHGLMFFVMWVFSLILPGRRTSTPGKSPFGQSPFGQLQVAQSPFQER
ncbi:MAG TPA: hypothetical protein VFI31_07615 [Pirellulales bacterium]|nr:hypothetical protein [Pirellulales bacterium]